MSSEAANYRQVAAAHLNAAKALIEENQGLTNVAYAALNLRMAIEALTYERLSAYREEVSFPTLEAWQPGRILKELAEIDPEANQDRDISIQVEINPGEWTKLISGPDYRFDARWALKAHNTLGSFLHVPTLKQFKVNETRRAKLGLQKALQIALELDRVLSSETWNTKIGGFVRFDCECGARLARRPEVLGDFARIECPECRALFDLQKIEGRDYEVRRSKQEFTCPECSARNAFATEWVLTKPGLRCRECKTEFDIALTLHIQPKSSQTSLT